MSSGFGVVMAVAPDETAYEESVVVPGGSYRTLLAETAEIDHIRNRGLDSAVPKAGLDSGENEPGSAASESMTSGCPQGILCIFTLHMSCHFEIWWTVAGAVPRSYAH